jgi:cell division septum initiation protein DivIVA
MLVAIAIQQYLYPRAIMAPRQTAKTPVSAKKPASRRQLMTPTKAKMNRPGRKPGRKPRAEVEANAALAAISAPSDDGDLSALLNSLTKQLIVQQQAIATQAWLTKEIDTLRAGGSVTTGKATAGRVAAATDRPELVAEIAQLRQENSDLREKAARLDQMATLLGLSETASAPAKVKGKPGRPAKSPTAVAAKVIETPPLKVPGKRGPKPKVAAEVRPLVVPMARSSNKASILKAAAERDVARTFKSCWPVVFKIEEWNAKNPARLAKISQTMLNKCGVNFARAKQFVEAHEAVILRYHNDIGLNKANSGKFNEVYEFVRDSLGKGRRS